MLVASLVAVGIPTSASAVPAGCSYKSSSATSYYYTLSSDGKRTAGQYSWNVKFYFYMCGSGTYALYDKTVITVAEQSGGCGVTYGWRVNPNRIAGYDGGTKGSTCTNSDPVDTYTWNPTSLYKVYSTSPSNEKCLGASVLEDNRGGWADDSFNLPSHCIPFP